MMRRALPTAAALAVGIVCVALPARAPAQPAAPVQQLGGTFQMTGTVTRAANVLGEHRGDVIQRTWSFTPLCGVGYCPAVRLVRGRANGTDVLLLQATGPSTYHGTGQFYTPLRCSGRIYPRGQMVPFTITVTVTATAPQGPATVVTGISATYVNRSRVNLTPCIGVLGHDAARYTGQATTG